MFDGPFAAIVDAVVYLLYGVIRLIGWILGFIITKTFAAKHFSAIRTFGFWLLLATSLYLMFGIIRAWVPAFYTPALTPIYQWQSIAIAVVVLLVAIALRELDPAAYEASNARHEFEPDRKVAPSASDPVQTTSTQHTAGLLAWTVGIVLLIGILSAATSIRHEATLAEKLCAQAQARISDGVEQTVRDGAGLFDRVFGTQTAARIPCDDP